MSLRKPISKLLQVAVATTLVAGCGGGGESASTQVPVSLAPGDQTQTLEPTWSLAGASPVEVGVATEDITAILDHVFGDDAVQSAMLVKNGYVIGERYIDGADAASLGTSWSVAKSFYSAAVGVAIDEGWIESLDTPASVHFAEWRGTDKADITIRHLLEMRGGLPAQSSIFVEFNQTEYALSLAKVREEGTTFAYSNPTSQLFSPLIERSTGQSAHDYLREKILVPIGIDPDTIGMWLDPTGVNPITYWGLDMNPEAFARFGLLYARAGEWNGTQVISPEYIAASLSAQSAFYGFQWWILNDTFFGQSVPINVQAALGLDGQKIYVWPDGDVVLVVLTRYAHDRNQGYVLSLTNFPDTCTGRNNCPTSVGDEVPGYDEHTLVELLAQLD
ncbi:MAG: serine hydrolase [Pseudomonadota bacterium]